MASFSDLFGHLWSTANKQTRETMARPVAQGFPQDWTVHSTNSQMPISLLVEFYKVAKESLLLTLRHPADEKTGGLGTHVRT